MKRVLIISYRFPPQLTTRSIQVARWVKFLPRYGWKPVVVCAEENSVYNTPVDTALNSLVSPDVRVVKVKSYEPKVAFALAARVSPFLLSLPDTAIGWYRPAYKRAAAMLKEEPFDLIFSCAYARTSNLIGLKLKRNTGLPWLAYFSDPWADSLDRKYDPITGYVNGRMEKAVVQAADAVIFISDGMKQLIMGKYPQQWLAKSFVISQCFDPDLVTSINSSKEEAGNAKFTITFTGNLYGGLRNLMPFFQAIRHILDKYLDIYQHLAIQIVGKVGVTHRRLIQKLGLEKLISIIDTVPYLESLAYMAKADVLLSLDSPFPGSRMLHSSKVAEYLGFKKPILAVTPMDAGWVPFIRQIGGIVVSSEDVAGIERAIMTLYQYYNQDSLDKYGYTNKEIEPYNAISTVAELARIFDGVSQDTLKA